MRTWRIFRGEKVCVTLGVVPPVFAVAVTVAIPLVNTWMSTGSVSPGGVGRLPPRPGWPFLSTPLAHLLLSPPPFLSPDSSLLSSILLPPSLVALSMFLNWCVPPEYPFDSPLMVILPFANHIYDGWLLYLPNGTTIMECNRSTTPLWITVVKVRFSSHDALYCMRLKRKT